MRASSFLLVLCLWSFLAQGQIDPSSALLLRGGAKAPVKEQLDRGRYKLVEPKRPASTVVAPVPKPVALTPAQPAAPIEAPVAAPVQTTTPAPATSLPANASSEPAVTTSPVPLTDKVKEMVMGGSEKAIEDFRESLHPEDARQNLMQIELGPTYVYTDSSSNYWFRSYALSSPAFSVAAQIWVTPFFGIRSSYINSLEGSIYEEPASRNRIAVKQQWFDGGFRWRTFYGSSRKAATLSVGLDFSEYQFKVPKSAAQRGNLKTVGAKLSIEATLPRAYNFAWTVGAFIIPRADHKEKAAAADLQSGSNEQSTVLGIWLGGIHAFDRRSVVFWQLQQSVERNLFENEASPVDPVTGTAPRGVSVTTGTTMFTFGFRWGH